ncbi:MAG: hypothetical protein AAFN07_12095 [Pseudomonadota bacterium]
MRSETFKLSSVLGLVAVSSLMSGCGGDGVDSETLETEQLWIGTTFEAMGGGSTVVNVEINEGGSSGANVRLGANERLEASANGLVVVLQEDEDAFDIDYEGRIDTDADATALTLSFFRADGSVNSATRATLPAPFTVLQPINDQAVRVGDLLNIQWSPAVSGGTIRLDTLAICSGFSRGEFRDVADNGNFIFNTGAIPGINDPEIPRNNDCRFTVTLTRDSTGTVDPAFRAGGFVRAFQERQVVMSLSF